MPIKLVSPDGGSVTIGAPPTANNYTLALPTESGSLVAFASEAITTDLIANNAITTDKIANTAVTPAKLSQPLTQMTAVNSTGNTSTFIDFNDIPSWANRVTLMMSNVSVSSAGVLRVQIGDSTGIANTGYFTTASFIATNGTADAQNSTAGFDAYADGSGLSRRSGQYVFNHLANNSWTMFGSFVNDHNGAAHFTVGLKTLTNPLSRIRVTTVGGANTFDGGIINVMYE